MTVGMLTGWQFFALVLGVSVAGDVLVSLVRAFWRGFTRSATVSSAVAERARADAISRLVDPTLRPGLRFIAGRIADLEDLLAVPGLPSDLSAGYAAQLAALRRVMDLVADARTPAE